MGLYSIKLRFFDLVNYDKKGKSLVWCFCHIGLMLLNIQKPLVKGKNPAILQ